MATRELRASVTVDFPFFPKATGMAYLRVPLEYDRVSQPEGFHQGRLRDIRFPMPVQDEIEGVALLIANDWNLDMEVPASLRASDDNGGTYSGTFSLDGLPSTIIDLAQSTGLSIQSGAAIGPAELKLETFPPTVGGQPVQPVANVMAGEPRVILARSFADAIELTTSIRVLVTDAMASYEPDALSRNILRTLIDDLDSIAEWLESLVETGQASGDPASSSIIASAVNFFLKFMKSARGIQELIELVANLQKLLEMMGL